MEDNKLYSINSMKNMEVIEMNSGARLGYIRDIKIDYDNKKIISIILPSESKGWFNKSEDLDIVWSKVFKVGKDVILVDCKDIITQDIVEQ